MILAIKHVPASGPGSEPLWIFPPFSVPDENALQELPDGIYAIYAPTKATVGGGPEATNDLPKSFSFEGFGESGSSRKNTFKHKSSIE